MNPSRNLKQTLTYWALSTGHNKDGSRKFSTPVEVMGRWEDKQELFVNANGEETQSTAKVFVASDVEIGGWLYLGISTDADPQNVTGTKEIKGFAKIPNLKATAFERKAWL